MIVYNKYIIESLILYKKCFQLKTEKYFRLDRSLLTSVRGNFSIIGLIEYYLTICSISLILERLPIDDFVMCLYFLIRENLQEQLGHLRLPTEQN